MLKHHWPQLAMEKQPWKSVRAFLWPVEQSFILIPILHKFCAASHSWWLQRLLCATRCVEELHLAMALPGSFKLSTGHFVLIIHYITKISHYVCSIMLFVNPECFFPCCPRQKGHLRCCGVFDLQLLLQKNIFLAVLMPYVLWGCLSKDVHHVSLMPV